MSIATVLQRAYEVDPQGTEVLVAMAAYDMGVEAVDSIGPQLDRVLHAQATEAVAKAKVALVRGYVSKSVAGADPGSDPGVVASWLVGMEEFLKSESFEDWQIAGRSRRRKVARDASGRFSRVGGRSDVISVKQKELGNRLVGPARNLTTAVSGGPGGDDVRMLNDPQAKDSLETKRKIEEFQGSIDDARSQARELKASLPKKDQGDIRIKLRTADPMQPDFTVALETLIDEKNADKLGANFANVDAKITGMTVLGGKQSSKHAQGIADNFNARPDSSMFNRVVAALGPGGGNGPGIREAFASRGSGDRLPAAVTRIGIAGELLSQVSPGSQSAKMMALVGDYGPEAMNVLGPHVKRAAYRYRGAERTPQARLARPFRSEDMANVEALAADIDAGSSTAREASDEIAATWEITPGRKGRADVPRANTSPVEASVRRRGKAGDGATLTGDQLRLGVRSDVAALELLKTLPKDALVGALSREAQQGLPSQGVVIDSDGDLVTQSVGLANDHYLPFNLSNLGRAKGGQLVRTRVEGGLTGEDVFATLMSGARSATVASGSGVFRMEMAPDFRGKRAKGDQAAAVYDSYLRILEAIDSSELYTKPLDPETAEGVHEDALRLADGDPKSKAYRDARKRLTNEAQRERTRISGEDRAKIKADALERYPNEADARDRDNAEAAALEELQMEKGSELNLNGEGYALALKTLAAQHPFFIRTAEYTPLRGSVSSETDAVKLAGMGQVDNFGFLAQMGAPPNMVRSTKGRDAGYVRRGSEPFQNTPSQSPSVAEAASESTPGSSAAPASAVRPGTTPVGDSDTIASKPKSGTPSTSKTAQRSTAKAGLSDDVYERALNSFAAGLSGTIATAPAKDPAVADTFEANAAMGERKVLEWLFSRDSAKAMMDEMLAHPEEYAAALSSDAAVSSALNASVSNLEDAVSASDAFGVGDDVDAFRAAVKSQAVALMDASIARKGFVAVEPGNKDQTFTSVAQAIDFPDITTRTDAKSMTDYLAKNPKVRDAAIAVGFSGDDVLPMADVRANVKIAGDGYRELFKLAKQQKAAGATPIVTSAKAGSVGGPEFDAITGLDEAGKFALVNGHPREIRAQMELLQRGRTVAETSRVWDLGEVGGASPKAPGLPKLVGKASSPLRVVHPGHPVAVMVSKRLAAGQRDLPRIKRPSGSSRSSMT